MSVTLGIDQSFLIKRFPKLTRAISDGYDAHRKAQAERRIEWICSEVKQAVQYLHEDGIYPSYWKVRKQLSKPWQMNISEAYSFAKYRWLIWAILEVVDTWKVYASILDFRQTYGSSRIRN